MKLKLIKIVALLGLAAITGSCASQAVHDAEDQPRHAKKPTQNGLTSMIH